MLIFFHYFSRVFFWGFWGLFLEDFHVYFEDFEDFFWRISVYFGGFWGFRGPLARSAGVFWGFWGFILRILRILMILRIFLRIFLLQKSPKLSKILQNSPKTMKKINMSSLTRVFRIFFGGCFFGGEDFEVKTESKTEFRVLK